MTTIYSMERSLPMYRIKDISLEHPSAATSGDERYLTTLWVSGKADELSYCPGNIDLNDQKKEKEIEKKIEAALKLFHSRTPYVLVQFWSQKVVNGSHFLETRHQPYGLGVIDASLVMYRKNSEDTHFVVDNHDYKEDSPLIRALRRQLPEWTEDLTCGYLPKDFPLFKDAILCNLRGYLALPVFDSTTQLCVGVIEILTSSKYPDFAYEVQQVHDALKRQNLTSFQVSGYPASNVIRDNELDKIFIIMKRFCETHNLPLAQTWAISPLCAVVSRGGVLMKSCNSFHTRCLGKVCMSTTPLPYYVRDFSLLPFRKACTGLHLDSHCGLVGRALQSRGSAFCGDVTKLSKEEYPLVPYARMSRLTSCFAILLHSVETHDDFVLEFFLQSHLKDVAHVRNLVQLLKHDIEIASGFELGVNIEPDVIETSSYSMDILTNVADTYIMDTLTDVEDSADSVNFTNAEESSSPLKKGTKRQGGCKGTKRPKSSKVKITYGQDIKWFRFDISLGLLELENLVAKKFKLEHSRIHLKYMDEENDLISICNDNDLHLALVVLGSNNTIDLLCTIDSIC